ncbi:DMT family transporter [Terrilactibacillus sp. S3-3]|nr:DMT family transporter [Terrilactibacillus sp. S3-3]
MSEGTNKLQWIGLAFGMIGLVLVVGRQIYSGSLSIMGILYSLLSLLSITIGTIMQKHVRLNLPMNVSIQCTVSFIVFSAFSLLFGSLTVHWTGMFIIALLFMALGVTVTASLLLYYMIGTGKLTNTTSVFYCVPPVTAILDFLIFKHKLSIIIFIGMVLIIIGMILINRRVATNKIDNQMKKSGMQILNCFT